MATDGATRGGGGGGGGGETSPDESGAGDNSWDRCGAVTVGMR